ncbi:MAG: hypothetical protein AMXMBFR64_44120 [Myxococcales bacterium]
MRIERILPLIIIAATSCDDVVVTPLGKFGDLGNGYFQYECTNTWDVMCRYGAYASDFPRQIALGARFSMAYEATNGDLNNIPITVEPVSVEWIAPAGAAFQTKKQGNVAIIARSTKDGRVVDYIHVDVVQAFDLDVLTEAGGVPPKTVFAGAEVSLVATPYDVYGDSLPGSLAWTWGTSNDAVVSLATVNGTPKMLLYANGKGAAEVTVASGGTTRTLKFEVLAKPGGGYGSDAGGSDDVGGSGDVSSWDAGGSDAGGGDAWDEDAGTGDAWEDDAGTGDAWEDDAGGMDVEGPDTAGEDVSGSDTAEDTGGDDAND